MFVHAESKFPYTVLYDTQSPVGSRVIAAIDDGEPTITISRSVDVRSLLLVGSVDKKAWKATKKHLDQGANPGPPGSVGNGNGRVA